MNIRWARHREKNDFNGFFKGCERAVGNTVAEQRCSIAESCGTAQGASEAGVLLRLGITGTWMVPRWHASPIPSSSTWRLGEHKPKRRYDRI